MGNFQSRHTGEALIRLLLLALFITLNQPASAAGGADSTRTLASASTERRVALVIGNDAYQETTRLERAVADARAMSAEFRRLGFEVIEHANLDRRGMNRAVNEFTDKVQGGGVGVLFFAGHGVQVQGSNYLLPVDVKVSRADDLPDEAIDLGRVMERIAQAKAKFSLMIIDACRDNPFPKTGGRNIGGARGLTIPQAPQGLMVVYSAGVNEQAVDRLGPADQDPNGLFTREFLKVLKEPGMTVDAIVKRVRTRVSEQARLAGFQQNPAIYDQASGEFYFRPPVAQAPAQQVAAPVAPSTLPPAASLPAPPSSPPAPISEPAAIELALWDSVRNTTIPDELQEYLRQFPNGRFAVLARSRLAQLSQRPQLIQSASPVTQLAVPAPSAQSPRVNSNALVGSAVSLAPASPVGSTGAGKPGQAVSTPAPISSTGQPVGRHFGEDAHFLLEVEATGDRLQVLRFIGRRGDQTFTFRCGLFENAVTIKQGRTLEEQCATPQAGWGTHLPARVVKGDWPSIEITEGTQNLFTGVTLIRIPESRLTMIPESWRSAYLEAKKSNPSLTTAAFSQEQAARASQR